MNDNVLELSPEAQRRLAWLEDRYQQAAQLAQQGKFQEGLTAFESCLDFVGREDFPLSVDQLIDILMRIAHCHADLHQYDEALRYYGGIESLLNDWVEALESDRGIEDALKQNRSLPDWSPLLPDGVRFFIPQSFDPRPRLAGVYRSRGNAYASSGELEQAIREFTQAVESNPDDAVAYNNRAYVFRKAGEPERAIHDYTQAIELAPTNADFFNDRWGYLCCTAAARSSSGGLHASHRA